MATALEIVTGAVGILLFAGALVFIVRKARADRTFQQPDNPGPGGGGSSPSKGDGPTQQH